MTRLYKIGFIMLTLGLKEPYNARPSIKLDGNSTFSEQETMKIGYFMSGGIVNSRMKHAFLSFHTIPGKAWRIPRIGGQNV